MESFIASLVLLWPLLITSRCRADNALIRRALGSNWTTVNSRLSRLYLVLSCQCSVHVDNRNLLLLALQSPLNLQFSHSSSLNRKKAYWNGLQVLTDSICTKNAVYWSDLHEIFTKDVHLNKKDTIQVWKSFATGSGYRNFARYLGIFQHLADVSVNKSSSVAETAAQCCTTRVVKRWGWVSFREKLKEKRTSLVINHIVPKTRIFRQISVAVSVGLVAILGEVTQNSGHYAVQGHSRSPLSVPIESLYATSYWWLHATNFYPISYRF